MNKLSARHKLLLLLPVLALFLALFLTRAITRSYGATAGGPFLHIAFFAIALFSGLLVKKLAPGPADQLRSWPSETIAYSAVGLIPAILYVGFVAFAIGASLIYT